jgi:hypothetical protein
MAHEAVKDSTELQIELIQGVHGYGAHKDVAFWVKKYGISISDLPEHVQSSIDLSSSRFGLFCELPSIKFCILVLSSLFVIILKKTNTCHSLFLHLASSSLTLQKA